MLTKCFLMSRADRHELLVVELCEQTWRLSVFSLKLPEEPHIKSGPSRHKQYGTPTRPTTPRTPKHRLSVDANLQIPDALNSASKKDLLRRVRRRHAHSAHLGSGCVT